MYTIVKHKKSDVSLVIKSQQKKWEKSDTSRDEQTLIVDYFYVCMMKVVSMNLIRREESEN